jgi:nucleotide-binding universal stress UspA family protein
LCGKEETFAEDSTTLLHRIVDPEVETVTPKRILLPICTQDLPMPALEAGVVVAQKFDAHLEGMHIRTAHPESKEFAKSHLDPKHYTELVDRLQIQEQQDALATRGAFEQFLVSRNLTLSSEPSDNRIATGSWQEITGDPSNLIAVHGGAFDYIVLSHPSLESASLSSSVLDAAIFKAARPVLLAHKDVSAALGQSIIIAWNRGVQSRRAVAAAMPFLERADSTVIVNITTGAKQGPEPEEIAETLAWHGVKANVKRLPPNRRSVGEILMEEIREVGADLLVMGAYSQHRLRDKLIGGVTKEILANADFAVFMAR